MRKFIRGLFTNRFLLFGLFFMVFVCVNIIFHRNILPSTDTRGLWFYSGIFMVLFSFLFIEPYYTSPKNVITNVIPLLLVFLAIKNSLQGQIFWWVAFVIISLLLISSILSISLVDKNKTQYHWNNRIANILKTIAVKFGKGKIIYSFVFVYFLITYHPTQRWYLLTWILLWIVILSLDSRKIKSTFGVKDKAHTKYAIGEIFGVQAKRIFLVKLFEDQKGIKKFDLVKFKSLSQTGGSILGMVFDTYLLDQEMWMKVLQLREQTDIDKNIEYNAVYRVEETKKDASEINNFVGIVTKGSVIGKIKFEYSKKEDDLQEGDLLELTISDNKLFYQVVAGSTVNEKLDGKNENGFIIGEAVQLGKWSLDSMSFLKFGWVPNINTPVFKANTSDITIGDIDYPQFELGVIPGTQLPSIVNLNDAISHHMAFLGVTGSGKSFISQEIIKQLLNDTKVICIDFTGEWKEKFAQACSEVIDTKNVEEYLKKDEKKVGLFELPELSNTSGVLENTQKFLEKVFSYAKTKYNDDTPVKIALVLEEAHTITPETTFLGDLGDYGSSKALVNKMGQIALQGRKYGVGLLIIAQRTANVSKTMLTQCNTVVCFQAFDETSFTFLGNYVGKDMVQALPTLEQYHAIVAGKASKSNVPIIVDLTRQIQ